MMILNPTDSDLQKAIDDITKTTSVEPMFSDPVAAPSMVPDGDDGTLGEAVGPFPEPKVEIPEPKIEAAELPNLPPMPGADSIVAPVVDYAAPSVETAPTQNDLTVDEVKKSALRDLMPLLTKMNVNPSQKFRIYQDAFQTLHDYTIVKYAYDAAKEIVDENERGEALLKIVTEIDHM